MLDSFFCKDEINHARRHNKIEDKPLKKLSETQDSAKNALVKAINENNSSIWTDP